MAERRLKIRFVTIVAEQDFYQVVRRGMADAAAMLGVEADFTGPNDVELEGVVDAVRDGIERGMDGFALCLFDAEGLAPVVADLRERGIPVIGFNIDASKGALGVPSIVQDFVRAGRILGQTQADRIAAGATVLITEHDEGISALQERASGIRDALAHKSIEWVHLITSHDIAVAEERVKAFLDHEPEVSAVFGTGLADTEGLVGALASSERDMPAAGFDLSPAILSAVKEGRLMATIDQQPYGQGFHATTQLVLNLRYGLQPISIDAGAAVVDRANAARAAVLCENGYR